jgi:hypothetical protein
MVPVGGMIVRDDGLEVRRGGRGVDVDAAFFISILGWRCCFLFVCVSAEWESSSTSEKRIDQLFNPNFWGVGLYFCNTLIIA